MGQHALEEVAAHVRAFHRQFVFRAGIEGKIAPRPARRAIADRLGRDDGFRAAKAHQHRHVGRGQGGEGGHFAQRLGHPAQAGAAQRQGWVVGDLALHPVELRAVGGQVVRFEVHARQAKAGAGRGGIAGVETQGGRERRQRAQEGPDRRGIRKAPHRRAEGDRPGRRAQHQAAQGDAAAHRMRKPRHVAQAQVARGGKKGAQIALVIAKAPDMAARGVGQQPVRQALAAPVDDQRAPAGGGEVCHHQPVFLDVFRPPRQDQHAARPDAVRAGPVRQPQPRAVAGLDPPGLPAFRRAAGREGRGRQRGGGKCHQPRTEASFIAADIEPSILSLPDMKAIVGFTSPSMMP